MRQVQLITVKRKHISLTGQDKYGVRVLVLEHVPGRHSAGKAKQPARGFRCDPRGRGHRLQGHTSCLSQGRKNNSASETPRADATHSKFSGAGGTRGSGRNASRGRRAQGEPGRAVSAGIIEGRDTTKMPRAELADLIRDLTDQMMAAARDLQFELAARIRDEIADLKKELRGMDAAGLK